MRNIRSLSNESELSLPYRPTGLLHGTLEAEFFYFVFTKSLAIFFLPHDERFAKLTAKEYFLLNGMIFTHARALRQSALCSYVLEGTAVSCFNADKKEKCRELAL